MYDFVTNSSTPFSQKAILLPRVEENKIQIIMFPESLNLSPHLTPKSFSVFFCKIMKIFYFNSTVCIL